MKNLEGFAVLMSFLPCVGWQPKPDEAVDTVIIPLSAFKNPKERMFLDQLTVNTVYCKLCLGSPPYKAPRIMWTSSHKEIAIKGQLKKIKCIFAGYPTPRVTWRRVDTQLVEGAGRVHTDSYGQELVFTNVDFSDQGVYECMAVNTESGQPKATHKTQLVVESPPYWKDGQPPEDVNTAEEESAQFNCEVEGVPTPVISWLVNGVPIEDLAPDRRRIVANNYVRYENVTKTDAQVLQCNASNKHGYVFANAYLNVLAEPPSFINTLPSVTKIAESQTAVLVCQVFGAPKPVITWKKDEHNVIIGGRFRKDNDGNLHISDIRKEDEGRYYCVAENKFGHETVNGLLLVRNKTSIIMPPVNQTVTVGSDVTLHCNATTDSLEHRKLKISWLWNGDKIRFGSRTNAAQYDPDKSLKITQAQINNTGSYTCNASTELDWDAVTVTLTVKGRPDPPYDVHYTSCGTLKAVVEWSPGSENNDPIQEYIVYYNTSFDEPDRFTEGARVAANRHSASVRLQPWTNFTFSVQARNSLGNSERSAFTPAICTTPQQRPYKNPQDVCSVSRRADQLVIVWQPILKSEQNGEGFYYIVSYKRRDISNAIEHKFNVTNWQQSEHVVSNQEMFKEYEIYVQSANSEGLARSSSVDRKLGYSGQDEPLDRPKNFELDNSTLTSSSAEFTWDPVDQSVERVRGFFKGYQLVFWKNGDRSTNRTEDIILRGWNPCPPVPYTPSRRRRSQSVRGHTSRLWPYSQITAGVLVLNGGRSGKLSDTIDFNTPEGPPSVVRNLKVIEKGSHHLKVSWNKPAEANGILRKYVVQYKEMPASEQLKTVDINNIHQTEYKIIDLKSDTKYIVYLLAVTVADGEATFVEDSTNALGAPSVPAITEWETGEDFVNVSWSPVTQDSSENPGHKFEVEYKKHGTDDEWEPVGPEAENNWLNVSGLESGSEYEFRVVAMNNGDNKTVSEPKVIYVGARKEPVEQAIASAGWFIILLCIILFLLLFLLLICLIRRNRGGKYAVHEKEKLRGHDSLRDDDDAGFGEYTRTPRMELKYSDEPEPHKKSQTSLNSEEKPLDSETDSLGEYEDPDPSKFNEDGSFIGQYGGRKKSSERIDQDGTTPSALSTFV